MELKIEQFYRHFWENIVCRNVFLLHKELLLDKNPLELGITDYYLQRIVISNAVTSKKSVQKDIKFRKKNRFAAITKQLKNSKEKYLNEDEIEKFINKKFGKTINHFKKTVKSDELIEFGFEVFSAFNDESGEELLDLLKEFHLIPEEIQNFEELDEHVGQRIMNETREFLRKQDLSHMFLSIDGISQFYNSIMKESLINSYQQNINLLIDKDNFSSRLKLFDRLYEINIIEGGKFKAHFECINCPPETFEGFINFKITPSKLKVKCPLCGKITNYLAPYFICSELFEHIIDKDGLLFFAVKYLFDIYEVEYLENFTYPNTNEIDFVLKDNEDILSFIELKMYRNDKNKNAKIKNLKETVGQIKKNRGKLKKINKDSIDIPYLLVSNIEDKSIVKEARKSLKADLNKFNIEILTPTQFHSLIEDENK